MIKDIVAKNGLHVLKDAFIIRKSKINPSENGYELTKDLLSAMLPNKHDAATENTDWCMLKAR